MCHGKRCKSWMRFLSHRQAECIWYVVHLSAVVQSIYQFLFFRCSVGGSVKAARYWNIFFDVFHIKLAYEIYIKGVNLFSTGFKLSCGSLHSHLTHTHLIWHCHVHTHTHTHSHTHASSHRILHSTHSHIKITHSHTRTTHSHIRITHSHVWVTHHRRRSCCHSHACHGYPHWCHTHTHIGRMSTHTSSKIHLIHSSVKWCHISCLYTHHIRSRIAHWNSSRTAHHQRLRLHGWHLIHAWL